METNVINPKQKAVWDLYKNGLYSVFSSSFPYSNLFLRVRQACVI